MPMRFQTVHNRFIIYSIKLYNGKYYNMFNSSRFDQHQTGALLSLACLGSD